MFLIVRTRCDLYIATTLFRQNCHVVRSAGEQQLPVNVLKLRRGGEVERDDGRGEGYAVQGYIVSKKISGSPAIPLLCVPTSRVGISGDMRTDRTADRWICIPVALPYAARSAPQSLPCTIGHQLVWPFWMQRTPPSPATASRHLIQFRLRCFRHPSPAGGLPSFSYPPSVVVAQARCLLSFSLPHGAS